MKKKLIKDDNHSNRKIFYLKNRRNQFLLYDRERQFMYSSVFPFSLAKYKPTRSLYRRHQPGIIKKREKTKTAGFIQPFIFVTRELILYFDK